MKPLRSGVAFIWDVTAPAEAAAAFIEGLGEWVPAGPPAIAVALHPGLAIVHLQLDATLCSPANLSRLEAQTRKAGGRFLELLRLQTHKREEFHRRFLKAPEGESIELDDFKAAAHAVRSALRGPASHPPVAEARGAAAPQPEARGPHSRSARRHEVLLAVEFKTQADFVREHATNISKGGLFVSTAQRPALNSEAHLTIHLPNGQSLRTIVRVVHLLDQPGHGGIGVAFRPDDAAFQMSLRAYLATLSGAPK